MLKLQEVAAMSGLYNVFNMSIAPEIFISISEYDLAWLSGFITC